MKIVITGSLGNIGKPLTQDLVQKGHYVTVISSKEERRAAIESLGATAAIGSFFNVSFLAETFKGADIVYLMEAWEGIGSIFDKDTDFVAAFREIGNNYKNAVEQSEVKRLIHLSSIGAHTDRGTGSLYLHNTVETILNELPGDVSIKFIRPVGFFTNLFRHIQTIKTKGEIIQTYGGDRKEPWVSPLDIAATIAEEMEKSFEGRTIHYVASDEVSPNEVAAVVGEAINMPDLKWTVITDEEMHKGMLAMGMNEWIANGFIEMQAAQRSGSLYDDFYLNKPVLGKVKLKDFAKEFADVYNNATK
ncbi:SDR family oxidoreductase [Flavobacterium subsaxonicum]|uniref:NAD-dependent dehydratase n=1 Tax=Flavobacterium subsaxonicum WB 4.1-42 = DSM 21790 TaxID=1121898 RepID=A0A0A2MTW4_9FLAO|nr:NAD(P)H-binding protein [Flavobacterium subsaxonicum]KGO95051.1 NAD-dependent dehydratase [Flavobacterium subsaxonicum WB 4.1-42 = DSM 21790]